MELRNSCRARQRASRWSDFWTADFRVSIFLLIFAAGCGAPGRTATPFPADSRGDYRPHGSPARRRCASDLYPAIEEHAGRSGSRRFQPWKCCAGRLRPDGTPDAKSFHLADTVPGSILSGVRAARQGSFPDPVQPEETARASRPNCALPRAHQSQRRRRLLRIPTGFRELVSGSGAHWLGGCTRDRKQHSTEMGRAEAARLPETRFPPTRSFTSIAENSISPPPAAAEKDLHAAVWKLPLLQIAVTTMPEYQDTGFDFGRTYAYVVRSVISQNGARSGIGRFPPGDSDAEGYIPSGCSTGCRRRTSSRRYVRHFRGGSLLGDKC